MSLPDVPTFEAFFHAVHGYAPYPWQTRLAQKIVADKQWPSTIGVPTGCGKTATMAMALWSLAAEAHLPLEERSAPRRVVMVVDRRTIVDQSFQEAMGLAEALRNPTAPPLVAVRERLLSLMAPGADGSTEQEPLQLALLRGGIPRDDSWARRPDQAILAVSTVDQVGSRLLFRGYGVGDRMLSMHAGLLGNDTLFLLDEVHLSRPFQHLLEVLETKYRTFHRGLNSTHPRWGVVSLSATSGKADAFDLGDRDRENVRLAQRLAAPKHVRMEETGTATHGRQGEPAKRWVSAFTQQVADLISNGARSIGVVVNRVDVASAIARALTRNKKLGADVQLVTGRMRPVDRGAATDHLMDQAGPGWRSRRLDTASPYVCVATQTIEAGADLDFDAMITEVASLDALVQRFGRVNRTGSLDVPAPIIVLAPKDLHKSEDPIYGHALGKAWTWLASRQVDGVLDASPSSLAHLMAENQESVRGASAPEVAESVLTPDQLDSLSQTSPRPRPSPPVDDFLHGRQRPRREITVVWRADVPACPDEASELEDWSQEATARLAAVPPASLEALTLPLHAARAWLTAQGTASFSDVEAGAPDVKRARRSRVLGAAWDGQSARPVDARALRPDMLLVLPSTAGGLWSRNFAPHDTDPVMDAGDLARSAASGRVHLRLDLRVYGEANDDTADEPEWPLPAALVRTFPRPPSTERSLHAAQREARSWLAAPELAAWCATEESEAPPPSRAILRRLLSLLRMHPNQVDVQFSYADGHPVLTLRSRRRLTPQTVLTLAQGQATLTDDGRTADAENGASRSTRAVRLDRHLQGVGGWARRLAERCLLDTELVHDLTLAGEWHDLGKAHPRFQTLLHGGDDIAALSAVSDGGAESLRAKSELSFDDRASRRRARERSKLPSGFRHEMVSVALLEGSDAGRELLGRAYDPQLVLHLVASHHGFARPFAPVEDHTLVPALDRDVRVRIGDVELTSSPDHRHDVLGSGVAERFFLVQNRYGWHRIAYLEAILRLADHRRSEEEEWLLEEEAPDIAWASGPLRSRPLTSAPKQLAHELTGLDGSNPLAFLAALGAMVALDSEARRRGAPRPRLSWSRMGAWRPVLHTSLALAEAIECIHADRQDHSKDPALNFSYEQKGSAKHDVKPPPEKLHDQLKTWCARVDSASDPMAASLAWFRGFVAEGVVDNNGAAKPTPLHFTAGQQQFLGMALELMAKTTAADIENALRGPWAYASKLPVMGWDATETRDYALRATNPSSDKKLGNPGADWMALRALVLFGTAREGARQQAPGTRGGWKSGSFSWPIWREPIEVEEVRALLARPELVRKAVPNLDRLGLAQVFRSRILRSDQGGYGSMLPAAPMLS